MLFTCAQPETSSFCDVLSPHWEVIMTFTIVHVSLCELALPFAEIAPHRFSSPDVDLDITEWPVR